MTLWDTLTLNGPPLSDGQRWLLYAAVAICVISIIKVWLDCRKGRT